MSETHKKKQPWKKQVLDLSKDIKIHLSAPLQITNHCLLFLYGLNKQEKWCYLMSFEVLVSGFVTFGQSQVSCFSLFSILVLD